AVLPEILHQIFPAMAASGNLDTHEYGRVLSVRIAVVELGDAALVQRVDERFERARLLRNGHRQNRLALLTDFGALGHIAQTIKVHVGTTEGGDQVFILDLFPLDVLLDTCYAQSARRLSNGAG